eukprot:scaffold256516_cov22-Tisochrysis_lutea.AAC.3
MEVEHLHYFRAWSSEWLPCFGDALQRVAVIKYARITSANAAWRMLIERHILPVAEACATKYDMYLQSLLAPGTMALLLAWEPQLKKVRTLKQFVPGSSLLMDNLCWHLGACLCWHLRACHRSLAGKQAGKHAGMKPTCLTRHAKLHCILRACSSCLKVKDLAFVRSLGRPYSATEPKTQVTCLYCRHSSICADVTGLQLVIGSLTCSGEHCLVPCPHLMWLL